MYNPIILKQYGIYDIVYNDCNEYIIVTDNNTLYEIKLVIDGNNIDFMQYTYTLSLERNPIIYTCKYSKFNSIISLIINDNLVDVNVNVYPSPTNEIVISTMVRFEDDYMLQFIQYYLSLGVKKFIIYDNAQSPINYLQYETSLNKNTNLPLLLKEYIDNGIVVLINWPFETPPSLRNRSQEASLNHALYAFRSAKLIGFIDVDEYLNPQVEDFKDLDTFFTNMLTKYNVLLEDTTGFAILSKTFKNPHNLKDIGFEFLKIYSCIRIYDEYSYTSDPIPFPYTQAQKCFINPKNVKIMCVHCPATNSIIPIQLTKDDIYINHYRFLNKTRDRDSNEELFVDNSINRFNTFDSNINSLYSTKKTDFDNHTLGYQKWSLKHLSNHVQFSSH